MLSRLRSDTGKALVRTFLAKAVAALGALALVAVVGRLYGPGGVGIFALAQSILLSAGIMARRGMDNALMRYVGRDIGSSRVGSYLYWAVGRSLWVSVPLFLLLIVLREPVEHFFTMPGLAEVLLGIGMAIPFYTLALLLTGFFKGIRKPATGAFLENGSISLVTGALILIVGYVFPDQGQKLVYLGWAYAVAAVVVTLQGAIQAALWLRKHRAASGAAQLDVSRKDEFRVTSQAFFIMGLAAFMQSALSVMIAGKFLGSEELGLFKSAQQIAISVGFVLMVINAIFPPRFAALYHQGKMDSLERLARNGALLGIVLAAPFLLICLLLPEWVLSLLGDGFEPAALLLQIIVLAQLVNVATGSVGFLLTMTGNERYMRNIALFCSSVGLLGFLMLTPWLGALGAALALAFVLVAQNLAAMCFVWLKLGIWTLPGPNWLALLGIRGPENR